MATIDLRGIEDTIILHFGKEGARINAYTLASALVALADAIKEANSALNMGYSVEVVVEALEDGSFRVRIRTLCRSLKNLFSKETAKVILLGVLASYIYEKTLAPEQEVTVNVDDKYVVIEHGNDRIIVPRDVYEAKNKVKKLDKFRDNVGKAFHVMKNDQQITSFSLDRGPETKDQLPKIPREDFDKLALPPEEEEDDKHVTEVADLQIIKAILERSLRKWEFAWRGVKISAPVLDKLFYDDFFAHRITIAPGDKLEVLLRIHQKRDPKTGVYTNTKYEVIQVREHHPKPQSQQEMWQN